MTGHLPSLACRADRAAAIRRRRRHHRLHGARARRIGASARHADRPNAADLKKEPERIVDMEREHVPSAAITYRIEAPIEAMDHMNLLHDAAASLAEEGVNALRPSSMTGRDGIVRMRLIFQVPDVEHVDAILPRILEVDGVFEARRKLPGAYVGASR